MFTKWMVENAEPDPDEPELIVTGPQSAPEQRHRRTRLVEGEVVTFSTVAPSTDPHSLAARLARVLSSAGADTLFGLPGGGPNLDVVGAALSEGMRFVLAHGETAAAIMASTYGRITNQPTPVVVTRGPGAASLANGAAQATLDRFPLVAITDTVPSHQTSWVPHQRLDQRALMAPLTVESATIADASTDADLDRAVERATRWPSGAVHLDFDPACPAPSLVGTPERKPTLSNGSLDEAAAAIEGAARPLVIAGFEAAAWAAQGANLGDALERFGCPVLTTYQAVGTVPTEGALNAGLFTNGALERDVLNDADLIVAIGLDEVEPIPLPWTVDAPVIRLSTVPQESPYLPIAIDAIAPVDDLLSLLTPTETSWAPNAAVNHRTTQRSALRSERTTFGPLQLVRAAAAAAPNDVTTTVDAGAHFLAVMPNWPVAEPLRLLISNGLATMGFAIPAAIGAALARPDEPVLAMTGDGGLSMVLAELETIARLNLAITVLVFNDAALSLIEIKQQPHHGGTQTVRYQPVDFAAIAIGSGLEGTIVSTEDELAAALATGWDHPRLIDARIDPSDYPHLIRATRG